MLPSYKAAVVSKLPFPKHGTEEVIALSLEIKGLVLIGCRQCSHKAGFMPVVTLKFHFAGTWTRKVEVY